MEVAAREIGYKEEDDEMVLTAEEIEEDRRIFARE